MCLIQEIPEDPPARDPDAFPRVLGTPSGLLDRSGLSLLRQVDLADIMLYPRHTFNRGEAQANFDQAQARREAIARARDAQVRAALQEEEALREAEDLREARDAQVRAALQEEEALREAEAAEDLREAPPALAPAASKSPPNVLPKDLNDQARAEARDSLRQVDREQAEDMARERETQARREAVAQAVALAQAQIPPQPPLSTGLSADANAFLAMMQYQAQINAASLQQQAGQQPQQVQLAADARLANATAKATTPPRPKSYQCYRLFKGTVNMFKQPGLAVTQGMAKTWCQDLRGGDRVLHPADNNNTNLSGQGILNSCTETLRKHLVTVLKQARILHITHDQAPPSRVEEQLEKLTKFPGESVPIFYLVVLFLLFVLFLQPASLIYLMTAIELTAVQMTGDLLAHESNESTYDEFYMRGIWDARD